MAEKIEEQAEDDIKHGRVYIRHQGHGRHGYLGALLLLILGIIFLLNNFNILPNDIWNILWRFWPMLLILWGLQMLLGKSRASAIITALIGLAIFLLLIGAYIGSINPEFSQAVNNQIPWLHLENLRFLIDH